MKCLLFLLAFALPSTLVFPQGEIPVGTIFPIMLEHTVKASHAHAGDKIVARVEQDIPLFNSKIPTRSRVIGKVVAADRGPNGTTLSIRFDEIQVHGRGVPITTSLRALASFMEVEDALTSPIGLSRTVSYNAATLILIGGDVSYRGGGPVMHGQERVGKPDGDGVLVRLLPNSKRGCTAPNDQNNTEQALWVFSSDACGIYGLPNVSVAHRGNTAPPGEIRLQALQRDLVLHSGDGLLLTVIDLPK